MFMDHSLQWSKYYLVHSQLMQNLAFTRKGICMEISYPLSVCAYEESELRLLFCQVLGEIVLSGHLNLKNI